MNLLGIDNVGESAFSGRSTLPRCEPKVPAQGQLGSRAPFRPSLRKRVLIMEDLLLAAECLRVVIETAPDLSVCGWARIGREALRTIDACRPDVVLLCIDSAPSKGLALLKELAIRRPTLRIVVLSDLARQICAHRAFDLGAKGYLSRSESEQDLVLALCLVAGGSRYSRQNWRRRTVNTPTSRQFSDETAAGRLPPFHSPSHRSAEARGVPGTRCP
jgi:DNA-binding NarL/FixJ family response regulator